MTAPYDCIIVGGGHNGLICAAYLAKAGRRVLVVEAKENFGGAAITRNFAPGFRVSAGAHAFHLLPDRIMQDLDLCRHGLQFVATAMRTTVLNPDGPHLHLGAAGQEHADRPLPADFSRFQARMGKFAAHLHDILRMAPPRLGTDDLSDRLGLIRLAWKVRSLGRTEMRELLRIMGMNIYDLLQDCIEAPLLQGALAFDATLGTNYGPRSPGTVLTYLYRLAGEAGAKRLAMAQPRGGMGSLAESIVAAARASGAELRAAAKVERILIKDDRAAGVVLSNGEALEASAVISNADPKTTFLRLLGARHLDTGFVRRIVHHRQRGAAAKLHLALDAVPTFRGVPNSALGGRLVIAPTPDYVETAFNPLKYGEFSERPAIEAFVPSLSDPSLAPPGRHVLSAIVQYAPYQTRLGWAADRPRFIEHILDTLTQYAPEIRSSIIAAELLTPADIEEEFGIEGGHWHHGELAFDQFFIVRPVPGATQYRTPVAGLFMCGAGCHPGGGVMGLAGQNAAREVLRHAA